MYWIKHNWDKRLAGTLVICGLLSCAPAPDAPSLSWLPASVSLPFHAPHRALQLARPIVPGGPRQTTGPRTVPYPINTRSRARRAFMPCADLMERMANEHGLAAAWPTWQGG